MHQNSRGKSIGGSELRLDDCHVWAAISYLDSPTDYRECLPHATQKRPASAVGGFAVETSGSTHWPSLGAIVMAALLSFMFLLLLFWGSD